VELIRRDFSIMPSTNGFTFSYRWTPLVNGDGQKYSYPTLPRDYLPGRRDCPGVYRWTFFRGHEVLVEPYQVLIGQSQSLLRRLTEYVKPTTKEEGAWKTVFLEEIKGGSTIECHLLNFESFTINGVRLTEDGLAFPFVRTFFESLMLILYSKERSCTILNKGKSTHEKDIEKIKKQ
jgi:hypothetical protein